jgi:hypothetical protein
MTGIVSRVGGEHTFKCFSPTAASGPIPLGTMKKNDLIMMAREILEASSSNQKESSKRSEIEISYELSPDRQQTETSTIAQIELLTNR